MLKGNPENFDLLKYLLHSKKQDRESIAFWKKIKDNDSMGNCNFKIDCRMPVLLILIQMAVDCKQFWIAVKIIEENKKRIDDDTNHLLKYIALYVSLKEHRQRSKDSNMLMEYFYKKIKESY